MSRALTYCCALASCEDGTFVAGRLARYASWLSAVT